METVCYQLKITVSLIHTYFLKQARVEMLKGYLLNKHVGLSEPDCVVLSFLCVYF